MLPISRCNTAGFRIILGIAILLITWQSLSPKPLAPVDISDKLLHASGFLLLAFLTDASWPDTSYDWRKFIPLMLYGVLIEYLQKNVPGRLFSIEDMLANAAGLAIYAIIPFVIYRMRKET